MRSVGLVHTNDRNTNQLQQNLTQALGPFLKSPLLNGYIIESVALLSGDNIIQHGLGRDIQGWIVTLKNADESIYDKQSTNETPQTTLVLTSTGTVTVNLYVF